MNIYTLLSTKERVKILETILYKENEFGVSDVARKTSLSKAHVSKYFKILLKSKIIRKSRTKYRIEDNTFVKGLKILLNLHRISPSVFKKFKFVRAAGLYGSSSKGTNTESSDIDIWVKVTSSKENNIMDLTSQIRKKLPRANILVIDDEKIKKLKLQDALFYYSLYFGSIIIYGDENEI